METGALDELAEGRVILGIGSGIGARVRATGLAYDRPVGVVRDTIAIVRRLLRGEEISHSGKVFSAHGVKLDYRPRRAEVPIFMAAMGDQALRLCGEIADGLMVSNMCAPGSTERAIGLVREAAAAAGRAAPAHVVQYVPCTVRDDGDAERRAARSQIGPMLLHYWRDGGGAPAVRAAHLEHTGIDAADFARAMECLAAGAAASDALDDRFVHAYAIAGTVDECLEQCVVYRRAGVTELGLWFAGEQPEADMERVGRAAGLA